MRSLIIIYEIIQSKKRSLSELIWIFWGQFLTISLGFITTKVLTQMGTTEYGIYSLVLTIASFISITLYGPAEQSFIRFYYDYVKKGLSGTYIKILYKFIFIICICILITSILFSSFSKYFTLQLPIITIFVIGFYIFINSSTNILNSILNILRRRKTNTILQVIEKILLLILLIIVFQYFNLKAISALSVIIISTFIVFFIKIKVINKFVPNDEKEPNDNSKTKKNIYSLLLSFGLPFAIWGVFGWIQSNSERWIIAYYLSTSDVGVYSLIAALANYMISLPSGIIGQFMQPIIYENISNKDHNKDGYRLMNYLIILIMLLSLIMTLFSLVFGRQLILLLSNNQYIKYWYILPLLCIGFGIFQIGQAMTTVGMINNKPKIYIFPKIISGVVAITLNILFIIKFGLVGIPIAIIATNLFYMILIKRENLKFYRIQNEL